MRFLTADYLYPLHTDPIKEGVLQVSEDGEVISIYEDRRQVMKQKLEIYKGIICPGFINAHCHLELSHLFNKFKKGKGLLNFIKRIKERNSVKNSDIQIAISKSEHLMKKNGIVGVGDICNTTDTLFQKKFKNLAYYNFIEIFDVNEERINKRIKFAISLRSKFREIGMMATIVPHAPYSVTPKLMKEIINQCDKKDYISTIHLQENPEENLLFSSKKGQFFNWLNDIGSSPEIWEKRNSSIDILDEFLSNNVLAVHNTFTSKSELRDIYYCTCPKANLYIENSLPDYSIFNTEKLCVGTDSLASNTNLCIFEELKIIRNKSNFDFNTLLKIGSKNGAEALGFRHLGTFERGKKPGVNLIKNFEKVEVII